jgi:hypothetical protein
LQISEDEMEKRTFAVEVYTQHPKDPRKRVEVYSATYPDSKQKGLSDYINYWYRHFKQFGHVLDLKPCGRPPLISDQEALEAAYLYAVDLYETLTEAAQKVPFIKKLLSRPGVTDRMLLRRMELVEPEIGKWRRPENKKDLTAEEKQERLDTAKEWLKHDNAWMYRIIWLDCKSVWVKRLGQKPGKVWGLYRQPIYANLLKKQKIYTKSGIHLKWYSAVNGKLGDAYSYYQ